MLRRKRKKEKERLGIIILGRAVRKGLSEKVTFMSKSERQEATLRISRGRDFQAEGLRAS